MTSLPFRRAGSEDLGSVVKLHRRAFEGFFLTRLGPRFLKRYYTEVLRDPGGILFVAVRDGEIVGFVAGYQSERGFYRRLRGHAISIGMAVFPELLHHPSLMMDVVERYRQHSDRAAEQPGRAVCLASIGVDPGRAGQGLGGELVDAFCVDASRKGYVEVYLTTDAERNEKVNRFYQRSGFRVSQEFQTAEGRRMNEYRKAVSEN